MDRARLPGLNPGQRHPDWFQVYETSVESQLPWFFPDLDPDIRSELEGLKKPTRRSALDIGCGLGNQAALLAQLGLRVTGSDISIPAILRARSLHPTPVFVVDDILRTSLPERSFDVIVDRGCFHILDPKEYVQYLRGVQALMRPKARFFLKVLSTEQGDCDFGPLRFSMERLHDIFTRKFEILKIRRTIYQGSTPHPPKAWFLAMRSKKENENDHV